ncbi:MAG: hypothetical protein ACR2PK_02290 [Acidimicrobiales bacterium]
MAQNGEDDEGEENTPVPEPTAEAEVSGAQVENTAAPTVTSTATEVPLPPEEASGVTITPGDDNSSPWSTAALVVGIGSIPWLIIGVARWRSRH